MPEPAYATPARPGEPQQPWLHDLSICVSGNVTALSAASGQVEGTGAQGVFVDDRRVLSVLDVRLGDQATAPGAARSCSARPGTWATPGRTRRWRSCAAARWWRRASASRSRCAPARTPR